MLEWKRSVPLSFFVKKLPEDPPIFQLNKEFQYRLKPPTANKLTRVNSLTANCHYLMAGEQLYKFRSARAGEVQFQAVTSRLPLQTHRKVRSKVNLRKRLPISSRDTQPKSVYFPYCRACTAKASPVKLQSL